MIAAMNGMSRIDFYCILVSAFIVTFSVAMLREGFDHRRLIRDSLIAVTGIAAVINIVALVEGWREASISGVMMNTCLLAWLAYSGAHRSICDDYSRGR